MTKNSRGKGDSSDRSNKHRVNSSSDARSLAKLSLVDNMPRLTNEFSSNMR